MRASSSFTVSTRSRLPAFCAYQHKLLISGSALTMYGDGRLLLRLDTLICARLTALPRPEPRQPSRGERGASRPSFRLPTYRQLIKVYLTASKKGKADFPFPRQRASVMLSCMKNKNIALLIDCENTSRGGAVSTNWPSTASSTPPRLRRLEEQPAEELGVAFAALRPEAGPAFGYTKGKNATDAAIIIDAMDILYTNAVDCFAVMSSDSDFTPLVVRLLESGKEVFGFGQKKTPSPLLGSAPVRRHEDLILRREDPLAAEHPSVSSGRGPRRQPSRPQQDQEDEK